MRHISPLKASTPFPRPCSQTKLVLDTGRGFPGCSAGVEHELEPSMPCLTHPCPHISSPQPRDPTGPAESSRTPQPEAELPDLTGWLPLTSAPHETKPHLQGPAVSAESFAGDSQCSHSASYEGIGLHRADFPVQFNTCLSKFSKNLILSSVAITTALP